MKVIVGLGNPGKKYDGTRHNVGFEVVRELTRRSGAEFPRLKFDALVSECAAWHGERVVLVAPQTFMNLSGRSVRAVRDFYKLDLSDILIVCDDVNLSVGQLRLRKGGSAGGQKGLADIVRQLGSEEVPRLRLGVGSRPDHMDLADYVLGRFGGSEQKVVDEAVCLAADASETWLKSGLDVAMNRFNVTKKDA
jgi:peptidyl-tRNA hydrolase, PTH1 family